MNTFSIIINGSVWGTRSDKDATIAEVADIIEFAKTCGWPDINPSPWLAYLSEFDDEGRARWTKRPATVEIETTTRKVVARWVGGERTL